MYFEVLFEVKVFFLIDTLLQIISNILLTGNKHDCQNYSLFITCKILSLDSDALQKFLLLKAMETKNNMKQCEIPTSKKSLCA